MLAAEFSSSKDDDDDEREKVDFLKLFKSMLLYKNRVTDNSVRGVTPAKFGAERRGLLLDSRLSSFLMA